MFVFDSTCLETGASYSVAHQTLEQASIQLNALVASHFWRPLGPRVWRVRSAQGTLIQEVRIGNAPNAIGIKIANVTEAQ